MSQKPTFANIALLVPQNPGPISDTRFETWEDREEALAEWKANLNIHEVDEIHYFIKYSPDVTENNKVSVVATLNNNTSSYIEVGELHILLVPNKPAKFHFYRKTPDLTGPYIPINDDIIERLSDFLLNGPKPVSVPD